MCACEVKTAAAALTAAVGEIVKKELDFAGDDVAIGETIASVVSTTVDPTGEVTITATSFTGLVLQLTVNCVAGIADKVYKLTAKITTSNGQTLIGAGTLLVGSP